MSDLKEVVSENFSRYAGNVILDRAICDVRDLLKPSARMLMYSQLHITKNIPSKPFVKSALVVGDCLGHYYTHGESSCYGTYMRMAKPFAMRYVLEDCQGNSGTITETGDEAAMRYTELRLSKLGASLFEDIDKETILNWYDNFSETDQYPKVLCSKGYYNICNGSTGIGVSLSASIPQFNLRDINFAMIDLIQNPNSEIDIMPDFATGAILLNESQVKESLKVGHGAACKLRSVIEYDSKLRAFRVKEIPYGVYTGTITEEIKKLKAENPNCGIDYINDGSAKKPDYLIYLSKGANPDRVLKLLYKETSLQSFYTINMTVLTDNGRTPKVMGLKDMLLEHIEHEKEVYLRGYNFDRKKALSRVHILNGYLIIYQDIDTVVQIIKNSSSSKEAGEKLKNMFHLDDIQVKAILSMKLSQIAKLEIQKIKDEKNELDKQIKWLEEIINTPKLLHEQMIKRWRDVAEQFGDPRRTKILNVETEDSEPVEIFNIQLSLTNKNNIFATRTSSLYTQRRGGIGNKLKLDANEVVIETESIESTDKILFFTKSGQFYHCSASEIQIDEKIAVEALVPMTNDEVKALAAVNEKEKYPYVFFITKNGLIKKSAFSEYNIKRKVGVKALNLDNNDEIVEVLFGEDAKIGVLTHGGNLLMFDSKTINSTGRLSRGVTAIKLNDNDYVVSAKIIPNDTQFICSVTEKGLIKQTPINEFNTQSRATKGSRIQKIDNDYLADFIPLIDDDTIIVAATASCIRVKTIEIPTHSRDTIGAKAIKLRETDKVIQLTKEN